MPTRVLEHARFRPVIYAWRLPWGRVLPLALFLVLVVVRIPAILTEGRFWAEEAVIYYAAAWNRPWLEALFTVHTGYLNLGASAATLLALHTVHLEWAPIVTATVALVIQTLPAFLLAASRVPWITRWPGFCMAMILLLISEATRKSGSTPSPASFTWRYASA